MVGTPTTIADEMGFGPGPDCRNANRCRLVRWPLGTMPIRSYFPMGRRKGVPMAQQIPLDPSLRADNPDRDTARDDDTLEAASDIAYRRLLIVNVVFYGPRNAGDGGWVLIDAGVFGTKPLIKSAAAQRFGDNARPAAIVLTHGHFDHVGVLEDLAAEWDVPVYAHPLEHPYLNGSASYPPPDPSVGGGLIALSSSLFPRAPVNVGDKLRALPEDGSIPPMPGWRWVHTPGHTPGHVSFWREADRSLIVGDAFVTTRQESVYAVATQEPELHGPPMYYTMDWASAQTSVQRLAALEPELAVTGHGRAMRGSGMRDALHLLAREFDRIAVPKQGRYVRQPARAEDGSAYRSP
jgi:glyoxylase-like metal-dependent hydrolase (beta-lactamase superfamily II)